MPFTFPIPHSNTDAKYPIIVKDHAGKKFKMHPDQFATPKGSHNYTFVD